MWENKLKQWLKDNKMSTAQLSKKSGVHDKTLDHILYDNPKNCTATTAYLLKKATKLDAWDYIEALQDLREIMKRR